MSWLNNSLNTIKGQLTTLAQEVLAETAGPGDDEYRGDNTDVTNINKKTAIELLTQTQQEKEQLDQQCNQQEILIASLRKQISELQSTALDAGGGEVNTTQKLIESGNVVLEDSWCWEPDSSKQHDGTKNTFNTEHSADYAMETVPLDTKNIVTSQSASETTVDLKKRIFELQEENRQLNASIEELDTQHNLAMQNVIDLKTQLQEKLQTVTKEYDDLKAQQKESFIQNELEFAKVRKQLEVLHQEHDNVTSEKASMVMRIESYAEELKRVTNEMAELQMLLEKKSQDNAELIKRVKDVSSESEQIATERTHLLEKVEQLLQQVNEVTKLKEKKHSESTASSTSKQSDDEFIVVRESDANSSGPSTPPSKEILKDKLVELENRVSELTLENGSLALKLQDNVRERDMHLQALRLNIKELQEKCQNYEAEIDSLQQQQEEAHERATDFKVKAAEAILAQEQLKVLAEEKIKLSEKLLKHEEALQRSNELEKRLLFAEQEKEQLQLELQTLRIAQDRINELESKIQKLTYENQQLKLNAEAESESLNNSAELDEKLKTLTDENESLRARIAEMKYASNTNKQEITDLDAEDNDEEPFKLDKARQIIEAFLKPEFDLSTDAGIEKTYKTLCERFGKINILEKNLNEMSEEIIDLQDSKLVWDHEKKTLEADISQYILQCDELMKNNEILLNELENLKRNKLESIPESNEEHIVQLEAQLEECNKVNRTLLAEYTELNERLDELDREKQQLTEKLRGTQQQNEILIQEIKDLQVKVDCLDAEKSNLLFELNEYKSVCEKGVEVNKEVQHSKQTCNDLESQLKRLSQDHGDLVAALQAQKLSLQESIAKRQVTEQQLEKQEKVVAELQQELSAFKIQQETEPVTMMQLKEKIRAKNILADDLHAQVVDMKARLEVMSELQQAKQNLAAELCESQTLVARLQSELNERVTTEQTLQRELHNQTLENASNFNEELKQLRMAKEAVAAEYSVLQKRFDEQTEELKELRGTPTALAKIAKLEADLLTTTDLQKTNDALLFEKNEIVKSLQQKHAENMQYYIEIQRLTPIVQQLQQQLKVANANNSRPCQNCPTLESTIVDLKKAQEKLQDQINFLKEKSDILTTNLLTEQTNQRLVQEEKAEVVEQNVTIIKDLERLRAHLLEIEELHTQETVEMQRELDETKAKMVALQQEVSKSSSAYTSASIRANQHAETLQAQYALIVQQRDELLQKLSLAEDRESKNQAALCNLQCALEQFQNDKEHDIKTATQRIRRELELEVAKETQLQNEICALNQQLNEANQGLLAASRLSDQLEACQQTIAVLRQEVDTAKQDNKNLQEQLRHSESSQTDKIDKNLIKSLIIGYIVSGNANDKNQVLRMISSVLEFTNMDADKVGLNKQQSSWLGTLLGGGGNNANGHSKDNLVQAFVQFLEQESQPKPNSSEMPNLLNITHNNNTTTSAATRRSSVASNHSNSGTHTSNPIPIQPLYLNTNILDDFAPTRNSSSILKDILSDS